MSQKKVTEGVPVICHDFRSIVSGRIREITDTGCELVSGVDTSGPIFPQKAQVLLNLLDEKSGKSVNVQARLTAAQRIEGQWVYRIRWSVKPEFLAKAA
jgi:hypothetical protein